MFRQWYWVFARLTGGAGLLLAMLLMQAAMAPAAAAGSAVVLIYHRFGEDRYPQTNIRIEQFEAHIAELTSGAYNVVGLPRIVAALKAGAPLPDRTIAITIDDAYRSVYETAFPRLRAAGLPFTLFISTGPVDAGQRGYMTWDQLREMAAHGATIGNHTASHNHMLTTDESGNAKEIAVAGRRIERELGAPATLFAYPFGEYSTQLRTLVEARKFDGAVAQFSGVAHAGSDILALPRFALNEKYGEIGRFRLIVNALPIPVTDVAPTDPLLGTNPPAFGFSLSEPISGLGALACFPSHMSEPARIERLGKYRFEVRFDEPFPKGRSRINCTMPGHDGRWRWLGAAFFVG
ncbi:MAG: polysaccharide deacetylase family protein [Sphingomonadales bacterium]